MQVSEDQTRVTPARAYSDLAIFNVHVFVFGLKCVFVFVFNMYVFADQSVPPLILALPYSSLIIFCGNDIHPPSRCQYALQ